MKEEIKYLIFSDESGKWNSGEYYIRSWVKYKKEDYDFLRKEVLFIKKELNLTRIKMEKFSKNIFKCKDIFNIDSEIFITISKPEHLDKRKYNILNKIKEISNSTGGEDFTEKIKEKILNSVKNQLFLNYFEKIHIENSIKGFKIKNLKEYIYIIDTPQYLDKDWEKIADELKIKNIKIEKKSKDIPGIEIADIIAGCISDYLKNIKEDHPYNNYIKSKMVNMNSKEVPNPNFIFYGDFNKDRINIFR